MNDTILFRRPVDEPSLSDPKVLAERLTKNLNMQSPKRVVLSPLRLPVAKSLWSNAKEGKCFNADIIWTDETLYCHGFGMGAPQAVFFAEIWLALGARELIFVGTAGALTDRFAVGEVAVVDRALRDEGVSFRYLEHDRPVAGTNPLTAALKTRFEARGGPVTVWSTDAIFRETPSALEHFHGLGAELVEMEVSAVFALAEYRKCSAAAVVLVTDRLTSQGWELPQLGLRDRLSKILELIESA